MLKIQGHFKVIRGHINVILIFQMFCTSASYLVARFHKFSVMHSRDTGSLDNLGPFGPIVFRFRRSSFTFFLFFMGVLYSLRFLGRFRKL